MQTYLLRMGNARAYRNYLLDSGTPFQMTCSNYTIKVECEEEGKKFIATQQSKRTFAAFSKIKKDVKDKPVPDITSDELIYFEHDFRSPMYIERVINIDLKSAYATILFNDGFITKETFDYLKKASKDERLASVGMLASRKRIFNFDNGQPIGEVEEIVSKNAPFFFYAVKKTYAIMSELKRICGPSYYYTWVDGIYFEPGNSGVLSDCMEYLQSTDLLYSVDILTEFEVEIKKHKAVITFKKDGKNKIFQLPTLPTEFKRLTLDAILLSNKKLKKNEAINFKGKKRAA